MATDTDVTKNWFQGKIATALSVNTTTTNPNEANAKARVEMQKERRQTYFVTKTAADGTAATATAETTGFVMTTAAAAAFAVYFTPTATITGDVTNNATITLSARPAAGGASVPIATLTTTAAGGPYTADVAKPMTLTAANVILTAFQEFTLTISKGGTGVVVPISFITILVEDI